MLTIEPKAGIRLNLGSYHKIHSYHGGGEFWEHQNQQVLMQYLGEFLPRAVENEGGKSGTVLFSHLVAGKDVLSQSSALDANGAQAPAEQLNRLRAAVAALKAKESDALIDPNARKLIQAFRLPDPQKDAELYRITSGSPRRLLVLWGVEKERNSALTPEAAVAGVPVAGSPWRKLLLALLLLLLLLGLGWWLWDRAHEEQALIADSNGVSNEPIRDTQPTPTVPPSGAPVIPGAADNPDTVKPSDPGTSPSPVPRTPTDPRAPTNDLARPIGNPVPRDPTAPTSAEPVAQTQPPMSPQPIKPGATSPHPESTSKGQSAPKDPVSKLTTSPPEPPKTTKSPPVTTPPNDTSATNKPTGRPFSPGAPTSLGTPPADGEKKPITTPPSQSGDTATPQSTAPAPMPRNPPGDSRLTPNPSATSGPPVSVLPDDMKLEITNSRTGTEPRNGKVEIVLTAMGRDSSGKQVAISSVKRWTIDGKDQKDEAGALVTGVALPVSLTEGVHKCSIERIDRNGRTVTAKVDVNVNMRKVVRTTVTPDVTVRPSK
jgi:hypothetical protein